MARNPVAARGRVAAPATVPVKPVPIMVGLLLSGVVLAVGIPWLAGASAPLEQLALPASNEPPRPVTPASPGDHGEAGVPAEPAGSEPRPFMDARAAGATAYAAGDYEAALVSYREGVDRNPADAEAHSNLGQILVRLNQPAAALPYFERAIALTPERWAYHFNHARALGLLQQWDASIAAYRTAQQLFPNDYAIAFNLAQVLHRKGDEAAAVEQYRQAIALDPNDASFRLALAITLETLQRRADAAAAYGEYLRLAPQAIDAETVRARIAQLRPPTS